MINYNTKDWLKFIFLFHKSDTFRKLFWLLMFIGFYSYLICFLEKEYFKLEDSSHLKKIPILHSMVGFVISLLLAYRTNTAYDRWWEGRKLWGTLVNNSRNLSLKLVTMLKDDDDKFFFKKIIPSYAEVLANHLCNDEINLELFDNLDLKIDKESHQPNQVAKMLYLKVNTLFDEKKITGEQLLYLNNELISFSDVCGACERIKNTPIPYSYSSFIKKFIFFYIMTLPFGLAFELGYLCIPIVVFIFYVLASLEIIAEEIEDPFGDDENDLPLRKIASNIKRHVEEIFDN